MQINTLEGMLDRKDEELNKFKETQTKVRSLGFNASDMNYRSVDFNSSNEFMKSEENERELNRLMRSENTVGVKIPGKIYSKKKF
jgi:hypothetical protein